MEWISSNPYPGRGLVLGRTAKGQLVQVYWIMGRSANSRNRVFVADGGEVRTEAADPSKVEDPSLIIYRAMAEVKSAGCTRYIATNGDQTDTIVAALSQGRTFEDALRTRQFEPDAPNYTPRISGSFDVSPSACTARLSVLRKAALDGAGRVTERQFHEYDFDAEAYLGQAFCITTYMGDGNPLPSFEGKPFHIPLAGEAAAEIADAFWAALNDDNKVSLGVKLVDRQSGASSVVLRNKYTQVAPSPAKALAAADPASSWQLVTGALAGVQVQLGGRQPWSEADLRAKIREHLGATLGDCFLPELGQQKKGKVRDIYFSGQNVVMVTNDRVSAFDHVLPNLIPFKGQVLNMISEWTMGQTKDIIPNALVGHVDSSVVVQKRMKNLNVEWIVRGYLWGSMAAAYEKGDRSFCGLKVPDGLIRFQKFDTPIFTPTTKAEVGHDENMTMEEVEQLVGKELAQQAKDAALRLYQRGVELMRERGLILIDTKYEFGLDEEGRLHVIDEVNTPDSSRLCTVEEWERQYAKVSQEMAAGKHKNVSELLKAKPELKIKEFSKQYVRDALLELGFDPSKDGAAPTLTEEQVVECAYRYVRVFEQVTGQRFEPPASATPPQHRVLANLQQAGLVRGGFAVIMAGSDSDMPHLEGLQKELAKYKVPSQIRICSAHKQPAALERIVTHYNASIEPLLIIGCAGGTDALSGTASFLSCHPVVSCAPDGPNASCLSNPPGSSNAVIQKPANVAKFAAQMFATTCPEIRKALAKSTEEKVHKLEQADAGLQRA